MTGRTSGLERDLNLVKRRWWLFIPFLILGIIVAVGLGSLSGPSNVVATMQLETVVHEAYQGGDRGFRIFEADQMVATPEFRDKVVKAIGDPNFDYGRFTHALAAQTVGDGVSAGTLTVSIKDNDKAAADKYLQAWVSVFDHEYTAPDGLFRTLFLGQTTAVLDSAQTQYQAALTQLKAAAKAKNLNLPLDQLVLSDRSGGIVQQFNTSDADLQQQLAEVQGGEKAIAGASPDVAGAVASSILKTTVAGSAAQAALAAREQSLQSAITSIQQSRAAISDTGLDPDILRMVNVVRGYDSLRQEAQNRYVDAVAAGASAKSTVTTGYSSSGGLSASMTGRVAVVLAITLVFGLIAIYGIEWLTQIRRNTQDPVPVNSSAP
ncbi:MAG: hypothetical protein ABI305_02720 [Tepidiformaceae bacterium]